MQIGSKYLLVISIGHFHRGMKYWFVLMVTWEAAA